MSFLDRMAPWQKQALMVGAPLVAAFVVLRRKSTPTTGTTLPMVTPSTDAIGVGQLAEFESGVSRSIFDLGQIIAGMTATPAEAAPPPSATPAPASPTARAPAAAFGKLPAGGDPNLAYAIKSQAIYLPPDLVEEPPAKWGDLRIVSGTYRTGYTYERA